jgi:error-prone DNA polymerase
MGFYPPATLVRDAQRRGVEVLPADVNLSAAKCAIEDGSVRIGISYVASIAEDDAAALVDERVVALVELERMRFEILFTCPH